MGVLGKTFSKVFPKQKFMIETVLKVKNLKWLTSDIFELKLEALELLPVIKAGQFAHIAIPNGGDNLLRRPFCLHKWDNKTITLLIAVVGKGTEKLALLKKGDTVYGTLPLGNGFDVSASVSKVAIIAGGVGVAPLLQVPNLKQNTEYRAYLGFANSGKMLAYKDYQKNCNKIVVSTDDGSFGIKGNPIDAFMLDYNDGFVPDVILSCGSHGLINAVKKMSQKLKIKAYMSGEIRMGCGVGACLVCACAIKQPDGSVKNLRACVEGPVFDLEEVVL